MEWSNLKYALTALAIYFTSMLIALASNSISVAWLVGAFSVVIYFAITPDDKSKPQIMSKEQTPIDKFNKEVEELYWLELQNTNGRETDLEMFRKGIEVGLERGNKKVLEALEREEKFFCENSKINAFRETLSNAEWRRLVKIHFRRSKKQK